MYYSTSQKVLVSVRRVFSFLLLLLFLSVNAFQSEAAKKPPVKVTSEDLRSVGYERQKAGDLNGALYYYLKAASLDPHQAKILNDLGVVYEEMNFPKRAEAMYREALSVDPNYLPTIMNLAYFCQKKGDMVGFIELLRRRVEAGDPKDVWTQKARQELAQAYEQFPQYKQPLVDAQRKEVEDILNEKARAQRESDLKKEFSKAEVFYEEGVKLFKTKQYKEALAQFDLALEIVPSNVKYAQARKTVLKEITREQVNKDFTEAMEHYDMGDPASAKAKIRKMLTRIPE